MEQRDTPPPGSTYRESRAQRIAARIALALAVLILLFMLGVGLFVLLADVLYPA
jgi:hypothetical protein